MRRPTQAEREAAEMAAGAAAKVEKEAYFAALPAQMVAAKAARVQKKADKKGKSKEGTRDIIWSFAHFCLALTWISSFFMISPCRGERQSTSCRC